MACPHTLWVGKKPSYTRLETCLPVRDARYLLGVFVADVVYCRFAACRWLEVGEYAMRWVRERVACSLHLGPGSLALQCDLSRCDWNNARCSKGWQSPEWKISHHNKQPLQMTMTRGKQADRELGHHVFASAAAAWHG